MKINSKQFFKNSVAVLGASIIIASPSYLTYTFAKDANHVETSDYKIQYQDTFVYESFEISEVGDGYVRGDLLTSTSGDMGSEGIYLDSEIFPFFNDYKLKMGDRIVIKYNESDYKNMIWDNIVELEVL